MTGTKKSLYPRALSKGEETLALHLRANGFKFEREHRFHPHRLWRFDFAFPNYILAVEIDGATNAEGRHTRGAGFAADCEKMNAATLLGWRILRYTTEMAIRGDAIRDIDQFMGGKR